MRGLPDDDPMPRRHRWSIVIASFVVGLLIPAAVVVFLGYPLPDWLAHFVQFVPWLSVNSTGPDS